MTPGPDLQQLINTIKDDAGTDDELQQLATAASTISELTSTGDAALGFFVDRARGAGKSWVEISAVLGVSKQAAHKRFADATSFERFTPKTGGVATKILLKEGLDEDIALRDIRQLLEKVAK